jgi:hypothetical protein
MSAEPQQPTIAGGAELCLHSFEQCLQQAASIHPRELSLVEDQLARFSVWTANIGVFAPGRASMDHRLREVPDVQVVVTGLLEALDDRIQNCRYTSIHTMLTVPCHDLIRVFPTHKLDQWRSVLPHQTCSDEHFSYVLPLSYAFHCCLGRQSESCLTNLDHPTQKNEIRLRILQKLQQHLLIRI